MKQPIKAGDLCKVVGGVMRAKSPNINKTVMVESHQGEHTTLGVMWRCNIAGAEKLEQFDGSISTVADFPAQWLEKIKPDALPPKVKVVELEQT